MAIVSSESPENVTYLITNSVSLLLLAVLTKIRNDPTTTHNNPQQPTKI